MPHVVKLDRDLLDVWAEHGVPKNISTQEKRDELVLRLWALVREQEARIAELLPFVIQKCDKCGLAPYDGSGTKAERAFLDASIEVWREIDRLSAEPEGYRGLDQSTALRERERAAWEQYRAALDGRA